MIALLCLGYLPYGALLDQALEAPVLPPAHLPSPPYTVHPSLHLRRLPDARGGPRLALPKARN